MAWVILFIAGCMEIGWALGLKASHGMTALWPSIITGALIATSLYLLNISLKTLPVGTAYGVWTGIGTVGTALAGIIFFGESAAPSKLFCVALVVVGVVGLRLLSQGI